MLSRAVGADTSSMRAPVIGWGAFLSAGGLELGRRRADGAVEPSCLPEKARRQSGPDRDAGNVSDRRQGSACGQGSLTEQERTQRGAIGPIVFMTDRAAVVLAGRAA